MSCSPAADCWRSLATRGWRTVLATAFTATVLPVHGFALACQLDKGLGPEVDYMALRRAEDRRAAAILGVGDLRWLELPEAPHRGYGSAAELFGGIRARRRHLAEVAPSLELRCTEELQPDLVLAPQGLGGHVDHLQVIRAVQAAVDRPGRLLPRHALCDPQSGCAAAGRARTGDGRPDRGGLDTQDRCGLRLPSQIGFQFGGPAALASAMRHFAISEGQGRSAERFLGNLAPAGFQP